MQRVAFLLVNRNFVRKWKYNIAAYKSWSITLFAADEVFSDGEGPGLGTGRGSRD